MISIKDFAKSRGVAIMTVYSWIRRGQTERMGFEVKKIGNFNLIIEKKHRKQHKTEPLVV